MTKNTIAIFRKLFYSSLFLSAIPAVVIISFFPPIASEYEVHIEEKGESFKNTICSDLDSNGTSEFVSWVRGFHCIISL